MTNYEGATDLSVSLPDPLPIPGRAPKIWGFWATALWGLGAILVFVVSQVATVVIYVLWPFDLLVSLQDLETALINVGQNGPAVAVIEAVSVSCLLSFLALAMAFSHTRIGDYLSLKWPRTRDILIGVAALFGVLALAAALAAVAGVETPSFMTGTFESSRDAGQLPFLFIAFLIAAPIGEEALFRGFLYRGFVGRLGVAGAIIVTAALWAILHIQYELFFVIPIVMLGLLLGWIRWKSDSTLLAIMLHSLNNGLALLVLALSQ